jgi:hypothetical protein
LFYGSLHAQSLIFRKNKRFDEGVFFYPFQPSGPLCELF